MKKILLFSLLLAIIVVAPVVQAQDAVTYRVKSGDTLWGISQNFGIPVRVITSQNNIIDSRNLYVGQKLIINTGNSQVIITINQNQSNKNFNYTVKPGDTLWKVANKFNTTMQKLVDINNMNDYNLYVGQTLLIPGTETNGNNNNGNNNGNGSNNNENNQNKNYQHYTVQPGDILWNIAQKYNTSVKKLVQLNDIKNSYDLYVGRKLLVPAVTNNNEDNNWTSPANTSSIPPYTFYKVKNGDQIWTIADYFGIRVSQLVNYNNITNVNDIKADQVLVIPLKNSSKFSYLKRASKQIRNYYRVRANETISDIAKYYNIPESGLRALNHLNSSDEVYTGQQLTMPVSPALFNKHTLYTVKNGGEYIFDIAYNNGISIKSILKANYLKDPNLKFRAGTTIIVPQDENSKATWIDYENGKPVNSWFN